MRRSSYRPSDLLRGPAIPDEVLAALPKTDLHCHLDGSLRLETFRELGRAVGLDIPDSDGELRRRYFPADRDVAQQEFLKFFDHTLATLQTAANLERVAYELALDASDQGCWYLEARFCPLQHCARGLDPDASVAAVASGLRRAERETRIVTGIIITGLRTVTPEASLELARLAVDWRGRGVVAFDLAGKEEDYPAKHHRLAFYHCIDHNLDVTIHAGEGFGPASIHQALHYCGASRIGHGTTLIDDPDLLAYVNDHRIPLEVCLTSNEQTGVVDDIADHPFRRFLDLGLRVTLNTDNTLFARTSMTRELRRAVDVFDLTLLETENLLLNGFKSAFLPSARKKALVAEALETFDSLREKFALDDQLPG